MPLNVTRSFSHFAALSANAQPASGLSGMLPEMAEKEPPPRRYPRKQLQKGMLVAWQAAGARRTDRAKTLGMGGLYIETTDPAAAGAFIQLLIDTPEGEVRARAVVRNSDPGRGMGVEFVGMDQAARTHLHSLLKRLLPGTA